jgi:hypothetical protein
MADRVPGTTLVPAPTLTPYPQTLLAALSSLNLLGEAPLGSHLQNGVAWESDAVADAGNNDDISYSEGEFSSGDKTIQHGIGYTAGFAFELVRLVELGIGSGGTLQEQQARAIERFEAWESYDVARHLRVYLEANDTVVAGTFSPLDAASALMANISLAYPTAPMILSGRGPSVKLLKDSAVELAGGIYVVDAGIGIGDSLTGKMYATGTVSVFRTPAIVSVVPNLPVNEARALVERSYYVVVDGPIYSTGVTFATAIT